MHFPYEALELSPTLAMRWERYVSRRDRPRDQEEGLWRRTQDPRNAVESGWTGPKDGRRRILHYRYRYRYDTKRTGGGTVLTVPELYVFHSASYPAAELAFHFDLVRKALADGGWQPGARARWRRGGLECTVVPNRVHPQDELAGRTLPSGYESLDVTITSAGHMPALRDQDMPWTVLAAGMRIKEERGNPTLIPDLSRMVDFLPFQVEVGCGMSVEAGVPPLHRLHEVYRVTNMDDHRFVLSPGKDTFLPEILGAPESKMPELTEMTRACLQAEPTIGHRTLRGLADSGHLVGPVITNNFDGLTARAGLDEHYVRRYHEQIPDIPLLPGAKSLLVIGSHADRRRVQTRARERGMKVFFLDREGFEEGSVFRPYLVEGARDEDFMCRREATPALLELAAHLDVKVPAAA
ncbi:MULTISPECIES: Sir2 family NAD-dependent protein deacetylase [unclassified Streptomyces]|uniref:Sir2 family NAD-dependent protein deacetylase n=1 Tax=unclassified Streptomyces TaxID=2593676 RepID=UPI000DAEFD9B|nr:MULTISPECIES: Sir2 family NAD-dependent protein deacetylase [unclassified Streptomyces]PZT75871.1 hypothetical protein DNK56_20905 [Streptomyces sp. AC1-42W]PZT80177.1 hypothetical protein DNK55_11780 [Streptomyces sp. AC1-42T]